jgi:hypothetical protein
MKKYFHASLIPSLLITALAGASLLPVSAQLSPSELGTETQVELEQVEIDKLAQKLIELDKYMTRNRTNNTISFDVEAARRDGVPNNVIELAEEAVAYQNELMTRANANGGDISQVEVSVDKYPKFRRFRERARNRLRELN